MVRAFAAAYPEKLSIEDIINAAYQGVEPTNVVNGAHTVLQRLRRTLTGSGWRIPKVRRGPGVPQRFSLERDQ